MNESFGPSRQGKRQIAQARITPGERLIIALDVPTPSDALSLIDKIGDAATIYKIGYQLGYAGGLELTQRLLDDGKQVFLDLKLHDIGNTVRNGVESLCRTNASFLTVHAYPQTMRGAVEGRGDTALKLLAVTTLTSYDDSDLIEAGYAFDVARLTMRRARQAIESNMDGLIISACETPDIRKIVGPDMELITPGIRPAGIHANDQKRIMTPGQAIRAGADRLVVGRPIIMARDPEAAARVILDEIAAATT